MATYYVNSSTGSDQNTGTTANTAFATLQKAHDQTNAGDTVSVAPGKGYGNDGSQNPVLTITRSGSAGGGYITYRSSSGLPVITSNGGNAAVQGNASYIKFGGDYTTPASGGFEIAGNLASCTLAEALNVIYTGTRNSTPKYFSGGINFWSTTATGVANHIQINNCYVHDFPDCGIGSSGVDWIWVQGNKVVNCGWYSSHASTNITMGTLTDSDTPSGGTVTKCFIIGNQSFGAWNYVPFAYFGGNYCSGPATGSVAGGAGNHVIPFASIDSQGTGSPQNNCVVHSWTVWNLTHPASIPVNSGITAFSGTTSITINNAVAAPGISNGDQIVAGAITDGEGIIIDSANDSGYQGRTLIANNICAGNGSCGIMPYNSNYVDIVYNTLYNNQLEQQLDANQTTHYGDIQITHSYSSTCHNNLILGGTAANQNVVLGTYDISTSAVSYNMTGGGGGTPQIDGTNNTRSTLTSTFAAASINPTVADFHLNVGSPPINAANNTWTVATDIFGAIRPQGAGYDFGAAEYGAGVAETITSIVLSRSAFQYSATSTAVGTISVVTTGAAFAGTIAVGGADAAKFSVPASSPPYVLNTVGSVLAGSPFSITLTASQNGVTSFTSPTISITGYSPIATAYTVNSPFYISANEMEDGRAAGSIKAADARNLNESAHVEISSYQGGPYTFDITDRGTCIAYNGSSPGTFTVPTNAASPIPVGTIFDFIWYGTGALTIAAQDSNTTALRSPRSLTLRARYSDGSIRKINTDEWLVGGDFA